MGSDTASSSTGPGSPSILGAFRIRRRVPLPFAPGQSAPSQGREVPPTAEEAVAALRNGDIIVQTTLLPTVEEGQLVSEAGHDDREQTPAADAEQGDRAEQPEAPAKRNRDRKTPVDSNAPRTARNAYNFFCAELKIKQPTRKRAKPMLQEWTELDKAAKAPYFELADRDRERLSREMARYKLKVG